METKIENLYVDVNGEKYIDIPKLYDLNCDVYIVFGERTGGKTYSVFKGVFDEFVKTGKEFVYMRTREDYIKGGKALRACANNKSYVEQTLWKSEALLEYRSGDFLKKEVDRKGKWCYTPIGHAMSVGAWAKYKSNGYDNVTTIFFDEFIEDVETSSIRPLSLDEFIKGYMQNLSTIIRRRKDVKVVACANSLNPNSPLFVYYGINAREIQQGKIYIFKRKFANGEELKICVLYTQPVDRVSIDKHIAVFENETTAMTVSGAWQEKIYPDRYNGMIWHAIMKRCSTIYISDYNITIGIPNARDLPLVVVCSKYRIEQTLSVKELYLYGTRIRQILLYYKQIDFIISDGAKTAKKFNDLIRRIVIDKN